MFFHSVEAHLNKTEDEFEPKSFTFTPSIQRFNFPVDEKTQVHRPLEHRSGDLHTTGEAIYTADMHFPECLHGHLILSKRGHADILKIDDSKARQMKGVHAIYYASDLPSNVAIGGLSQGCIFADKKTEFYGQPIGIVIADTADQARAAAHVVEIEYEDRFVVNNIDDAIKAGTFSTLPLPFQKELNKGDVKKGFEESDVTLNGTIYLGGCVHYYMEPHVHVVVPGERDELKVYTTTQSVDTISSGVSHALNIGMNKVEVICKRLGGGFGGKGNVGSSAAVAFAATKLNRTVKMVVDREVDLLITPKRPAYKFVYRVGAKRNGALSSLEMEIFSNGGYNGGFAPMLMAETLESLDSVYNIPHCKVTTKVCLTNRVPSQFMRGAGTPQAITCIETILEHVAVELNLPPARVRELNFYKDGDETPFHQVLNNFPELRLNWERVQKTSELEKRQREVAEFNQKNKFKKRGLSVTATRYGIGPPGFRTMLKSNAFVSLLPSDCTALVQHAGIEMGQGLHTKIQQIASTALGIPMEKVFLASQSSYTVPNAFATGGSYGTDVHGAAVLNACKVLNERLAPLKATMPDKSLQEVLVTAGQMGMNLTAQGYHLWEPWTKGHDMLYYTWNAGVAEVELDVLTGKYTFIKVDCIQDVGKSLNPALDVGQIEGAFVQSLSWLTTEDLEAVYDANGVCDLTPDTYEFLGLKNVPHTINVEILPGGGNPHAPYSSKGIGEPPYNLGIIGALAVRNAIAAHRQEHGLSPWFQLDFPLTRARVRAALGDIYSKTK